MLSSEQIVEDSGSLTCERERDQAEDPVAKLHAM